MDTRLEGKRQVEGTNGAAMKKKREWIVTVECTVKKAVYCSDCSEEQARFTPWEFAKDETEIAMTDWTVERVEPND